MSFIKRQLEAGYRNGENPVVVTDIVNTIQKSLLHKLPAAIQSKGLVASGKLLNSLKVEVRNDYGEVPNIRIRYQIHGKVVEVESAVWNKLVPIAKLKAWVKRRGVENFDFVPGYENGLPSRTVSAERIAWGIAKYRASAEGKNQYGEFARKKKWAVDNIGITTSHMAHLVAERYAETVQEAIAMPLEVKTFP